jgi:hypothetical protein
VDRGPVAVAAAVPAFRMTFPCGAVDFRSPGKDSGVLSGVLLSRRDSSTGDGCQCEGEDRHGIPVDLQSSERTGGLPLSPWKRRQARAGRSPVIPGMAAE